MSFAVPGLTHCSDCFKPLSMNESCLCHNCEEKAKQKAIRREKMENDITKESIKADMKALQEVIQKFVNKYDMQVEIYYDSGNRVYLSVNLKV